MNTNETGSPVLYNMSEVVAILHCGIGKHDLMAFLRKREVLQEGNIAFQKYIENGYFTTRYKKVPTKFHSSHTYPVTLATEKGLSFIKELLKNEIQEPK
jgi:phage antirepressor YoqD-like protein